FFSSGDMSPVLPQSGQSGLLKGFSGTEPQSVIEPEACPVLQVFSGAVFTLAGHPGNLQYMLCARKQGCAAATTKTEHHAGLGQFTHGSLSNRGARTQQHRGGVSDGNVPVQGLFPCIGHVLHPTTVYKHSTMLKVVQVGSLGMQD